MGKLKDWADKQSPYIKLNDGESFVGQYLGFKEVSGQFGKAIRYTFLVDSEEKLFEKSSMQVAYAMDEIPENGFVRITRYGEGNKTKYEIEAVEDEKGDLSKDDKEYINETMSG